MSCKAVKVNKFGYCNVVIKYAQHTRDMEIYGDNVLM